MRTKGLTTVLAVIAIVFIAACNQEPSSGSIDELETMTEPSAPTGPRFADEEPPALHADLADLREVNALRVLIHHHDLAGLEREGAPTPPDIPLIKLFAERLRLPIRWIVVTDRDRLIPALLEGRGDLIAHALTITEDRAQQVIFSAPVRSVDEVVVVAQDTVAPPRDARALVAMDRESNHVPPHQGILSLRWHARRGRPKKRRRPGVPGNPGGPCRVRDSGESGRRRVSAHDSRFR